MCVNHNTSAGNEHDSSEKEGNQVLKITKGITIQVKLLAKVNFFFCLFSNLPLEAAFLPWLCQ